MPRDDTPEAARAFKDEPMFKYTREGSNENPRLPGYLRKTDPRRACANCGKVMKPVSQSDETRTPYSGERSDGTKFSSWRVVATIVRILGYGYNAEGVFCSLKCGYKYGKRKHEAAVADAGRLARVVVECDGV